jgi:hypothetical protein
LKQSSFYSTTKQAAESIWSFINLLGVAENCRRRWWLLWQLFRENLQILKYFKARLNKLEQWACYRGYFIIIFTNDVSISNRN